MNVARNMLRNKFYLALLILAIFAFGLLSSTHKAAAVTDNTLNDLVVSDVNAAAGNFSSPISVNYLYVPYAPAGTGGVGVNVSVVGGGKLRKMYIQNKTNGNCGTNVGLPYENSPPDAGFKNGSIAAAHGETDRLTAKINGVDTEFNVYCVFVNTSRYITPVGTQAENVRFNMSTSLGSYLGTFPGATGAGTGYFKGGSTRKPLWNMSLDFATPCSINGNGNGTDPGAYHQIELYDLDNGYSQDENITVSLIESDRGSGAYKTSPQLQGDVTYKGAGYGALIYETIGSNVFPYNDNYTWKIYPTSYNESSRYTLNISGIGGVNKIRVKLPYDSMNSTQTCPKPVDVCPNITGIQLKIPDDMIKDASGNCVTPTDVCPNIAGNQASIPAGMIKDASGNCVTPIPTGEICQSYTPFAAFNTLQRINFPRSGTGNEVDPWVFNGTAGPVLGPYTSESTTSDIVTDTSEVLRTRRAVTYYKLLGYSQAYRNAVSPAVTKIVSVTDQYGDALAVDTPLILGDQFLDYKTYFKNHPYDEHTPQVRYTIGYEIRQRIGEYYDSTTQYQDFVQTRYRADKNAAWGPYSPLDRSATPVPGSNFGAPPATVSWASTTVSDDLSYSYRHVGNNYLLSGVYPAYQAPTMPPCYPRQFSAQIDSPGAVLAGGQEDPTGSTFTFYVKTKLTIANGGALKTPTKVTDPGLDYKLEWRTAGYSGLNSSGSSSGTFTVENSDSGSDVTATTGPLSSSIPVKVPINLKAGDQICWSVTIAKSKGTVAKSGKVLTSGPGPVTGSACSQKVYDEPYTRFYGADIFAGGGFKNTDGTCDARQADAAAIGPMRLDRLSGSGSELAVFALGLINGIQPLAQSNRSPAQLAFSNVGSNVNGKQFGGSFGSVLCADDYFAKTPPLSSSDWQNVTSINLATLSSGKHYYKGDVSLYGQLPDDSIAGKGRRVVVYVDGDVSVRAGPSDSSTGKVGFANNSQWGSADLIPSIYLISNGNILIDDGISELDGSYISQGGEIFTCAQGFSIPAQNSRELTESCRTKLRVNGAFIANKINLYRTSGSLRESVVGEGYGATNASESVIYNPTMWMTNGGGLPSNSKIQIESYISLPPTL